MEDKTKIIGFKNGTNVLEVFNIQNKSVETSIMLDTKISGFNIFYKDNILLLMTDLKIYIFNAKTISIIQQINIKKIVNQLKVINLFMEKFYQKIQLVLYIMEI